MHTVKVNRLSILIIIKTLSYDVHSFIIYLSLHDGNSNRNSSWKYVEMDCNFTVISRIDFYVSTFCAVKQPMFPFSTIVSMLLLAACLTPHQLPSMVLRMHATPPPPSLPLCLPSMILRMHASPASLQFWYWNLSDYLLQIPFSSFDPILNSHALFRSCFIHFDFLIILTMRRNYSLVSHICL